MSILFITQKIDNSDDVLGVYHEWVRAFAKRVQSIEVICLYRGSALMPENVRIHSLGKERGNGKLKQVRLFFKYIVALRRSYDVVFVHMNSEYVALGGIVWKIFKKKIFFWYAHPAVNMRLRIASFVADGIITSVRSAFPLARRSVHVVGQGIDTKHFSPKPFFPRGSAPFTLLCVGRIARVKRLDVLLRAIKNLPVQANGRMVHCTIIGSTAPHDARYGEELCDAVVQSGIEDRVTFAGSVANRNMPDRYRGADVCVNLTERGFFDKTTLEAMACGRVVLVANEEFGNILPAELHNTLMFRYGDADMLATKLLELFNMTENERERIGATLRDIAVERYDVQGLAERITHVLNTEAYG